MLRDSPDPPNPPSCVSVSQAVDNTAVPQWQRRHLQEHLRTLQRSSNTAIRKLEAREVSNARTHIHTQTCKYTHKHYNVSVMVSHDALQAKAQAQALLEKNCVKDVLVSVVDADSLSVRTRPLSPFLPPPSLPPTMYLGTSDL